MNADILLKHFDRISDAPDAVARLRRFILDLAVRGKLVEQDPNDEPAAELLKRIRVEKAKLAKEGKAKKEKPLAPIAEDEVPFPLPSTWVWVRLQDITSYIQRGKSPTYAIDDGFPVVSQKCVQWQGLNLSPARQITKESIKKYEAVRFLRKDDLLWNSTGTGTIGRVVRVVAPPPNLICDSHVTVVRCTLVNAEYARLWISSDHVYRLIEDRAAGSTNQVELTAQMATNQVAPLPPLAEQHRIVAKVDELMALCDQLESARNEREAQRDRLVAASLHRIGTAPAVEGEEQEDAQTVTTLPSAARFHLDHLPRLTTRVEHIKQLRQTILNLAVRGRLVPQDPKDEPAAELLKRIQAEKARGWKNVNEASRIDNENVPQNWVLAPLIALGTWAIGAGFPKNEQGLDVGTYFFLKVSDMNRPGNEKYITSSQNFIDHDAAVRMRAKIHPQGTIIFPKIGGAIATNKRRILTRGAAIDNNCLGITFSREVDIEWAYLLLTSLDFTQYQAGTAVPALQQGVLERILISLPPLAEQHRIVAKVDELMALCDQLEAQLTTTETDSRRLLEAVLVEALGSSDVNQQMQPARSLNPAESSTVQARRSKREAVEIAPTVTRLKQVEPKPLAESRNIPGAILGHLNPGREYSRAEILTAIGLSETDWTWAIRQLKAEGRVVQKGEKRGARYALA